MSCKDAKLGWSYTGPGTPVVPEIDPQAALKRILTSGGGTGGTVAPVEPAVRVEPRRGRSGGVIDAVARAQSERRSALDYLKAISRAISQRVGAGDRARLDGTSRRFVSSKRAFRRRPAASMLERAAGAARPRQRRRHRGT